MKTLNNLSVNAVIMFDTLHLFTDKLDNFLAFIYQHYDKLLNANNDKIANYSWTTPSTATR